MESHSSREDPAPAVRRTPSYTRAAFLEPANLLALTAGVALSLGRRAIWFLPVIILSELIYLYIAPRLSGYRRLVLRRHRQDLMDGIKHAAGRMIREADEHHQGVHAQLANTIKRIVSCKEASDAIPPLGEEEHIRLHQLLLAHARMAVTAERWRERLAEHESRALRERLEQARRQLEQATTPELTAIHQRNVEVLESRGKALERLAGSREQLLAQLELMANSFHLLLDRALAVSRAEDRSMEMETLLELVLVTEQVARDGEALVEQVNRSGILRSQTA